MASSGLKQVLLRNEFYRDNFRRMVFVVFLSLILNIILTVALLYKHSEQQEFLFFATTPSGELIKLQALDQPLFNDEAVIGWLSRTIPQIYALDFMHYREDLARAQPYFTPFGWKQFMTAFTPVIEKVKAEKMVANAIPLGIPVVTDRKMLDGRYTWYVQVPLQVTFQKGDRSYVNRVVWSLVLQRVNNLDDKDLQLLGIAQIVQQDLGGQ